MSSDYYPPKGPEWVAPEELRRDSKHTAALLAEKYSHDVMNFRSQFFAKLAAHGAIHAGYGWATFNSEGEESSLATVGIAEVLLFCRPAIQPSAAGDHVVPVIRIITNEPVVYSGEGIEDFSYLTEEVTVDDDDDAQYLMDAVLAQTNRAEQTTEQRVANVLESLSPLFMVKEGRLQLSKNLQPATPVFRLTHPFGELPPTAPFGYPNVMEDRIYALGKAQGLLDGVMAVDPTYVFEVPAA